MKLSVVFLYLQLRKHYREIRMELPGNENVFCANIRMLPEISWIPNEDTLYLTDCSLQELNESDFPAGSRFIVFDDSLAAKSKYPCLVFPAALSKSRIFDDILSIFYQYDNWSKAVTEAILRKESLQNILNITGAIEENPMYFADKSFKMLANISRDLGEISVIWRYQLKYGYLPFNVMMDLVETGEMDLLDNTREAFYAATKSFPTHFVSKAIRYKGKAQGYFFIIEVYRHLDQCDIEIAEHLGNLISAASHGDDNYLKNSVLYHEHFMIDILQGTLTDERLIANQLRSLGWREQGEYRMLGVQLKGDLEALKRNILIMLTDGWDAHGFLYKDLLLVVYNEQPQKYNRLLNHLKKHLELFHRHGALSEAFSCFSNMSRYYRQIQIVMEGGYQKEVHLLLYEDYYLVHRERLMLAEIPLYRPVERLWEYDRKHGSEYCNTLFQYIVQERNTVQTAKVLYLHRNTMKYRLEKIEDIIQVPLDNPSVRQRLLDSLFRCLDEKLIASENPPALVGQNSR